MSQPNLSALIADPSQSIRHSLRAVLQEFDVSRIDTVTSVSEARRKLLESRYDIVISEFHFDSEETGQDLLEELRERRALPVTTIFIMVTGEAAYSRVVGVAEETPDDYLLKPVQPGDLADRIEKAFRRREALFDIYDALNARDYGRALKEAQALMANKTAYLADVIRIVAKTLYRLGRYAEAAAMYQRILATRNPAWAKLGLAKVALRQGDSATAEKAMLDIINAHLRYLPVYNQLSDFYLSEERYGDALDIIEQAIKITPHSIKRLQRAGQVAYSLGDAVKAGDYFGRALRHAGGRAVELDYRTIFHLALLQFEAGQTPDASSLVKQMTAKQKDDPLAQDSRRGEWYAQMAIATESIARREPLAAVDVLRKLAGHSGDPDFNFEIAVDYLAVIDRLYTEDIGSTLAEWVQPLAYRFASSRQAQELLAARVSRRTRLVALIERASTEISDITESAARSLVEGNAHAAAEQLAQEGLKYRNNRLLAAAANAAAKSFQQTGNADDRQQAEVCLASMCPPDESLTLRLRQFLNAEPAT